jgi:hypothetical protein
LYLRTKTARRYAEVFSKAGHIDMRKMEMALRECSRLGVPLTGYLISERLISRKDLEQAMNGLLEKVLMDAFEWKTGSF